MKAILTPCIVLAALACSCGNRTNNQSTAQTDADTLQVAAPVALDGQWNIENVVVNDTLSARPAEETPDQKVYIQFDNGNYSIMTNCNSIQGTYTLNGDSIVMESGLCTEMACDNMKIEDLIKQVLPAISTVDMENDSTLRLNSASSEYILLSRLKEPVK